MANIISQQPGAQLSHNSVLLERTAGRDLSTYVMEVKPSQSSLRGSDVSIGHRVPLLFC